MQRNVQGILLEGTPVEGSWDLRTWRRNGVLERSIRPVIRWDEVEGGVPAWGPGEQRAWLIEHYSDEPVKLKRHLKALDEEEAERKVKCLKKAAQRAKQACRRAIISEGFDELLTLTYRVNQLDRELCKKHFKEWVRRMKRTLPGFRYCASFERQERGAMHVHIATHKLPVHADYKGVRIKAWELGTKVWRSIVGADNGLCHVGAKTRYGTSRRTKVSLAKMAAYVSKYIMKDYEESPAGSNRYSRSVGEEVGKSEVIRLNDWSLADAIALTFADFEEGESVIDFRMSRFKDSIWLCTERPRGGDSKGVVYAS